MRALNYNHLRYFWVVAHEGRLTQAAERLGVSQSALSTQLKKLETQIGRDLFERRGRTLVLTEAGRRALDYADAIFAAGDELLEALRPEGRAARRTLRVGSLATLSRNFQAAFLRPLLAREDVVASLRSGSLAELMPLLQAHRLDVVLVNQPPQRDADSAWTAHQIAEQPVSVVGSPARLGDGGAFGENDACGLADLLTAHPVIVPSRASGVRSGFDALVMRLDLRPEIIAEVDDMAMMRVLARENVGLAVLPPIVVRDELHNGRLIEAATLPGLVESFFAITPQRHIPDALVGELLEAAARDAL